MKNPWPLIPVAAVALTLTGAAAANAGEVVGNGYLSNPALLQADYDGDGYRHWWRRDHRWGDRDERWGDRDDRWRHPFWNRYERGRYGWNDRRDWRDGRWR